MGIENEKKNQVVEKSVRRVFVDSPPETSLPCSGGHDIRSETEA